VLYGADGRSRRSNFRDLWYTAREAVGQPELHLHDLRHTGNTMAAATGASLRELMERMGHSSTRAAMIYQHATRERDQAIAAAMGAAFTQARKGTAKRRSGSTEAAKGVVMITVGVGIRRLTWGFGVERAKGIEPS